MESVAKHSWKSHLAHVQELISVYVTRMTSKSPLDGGTEVDTVVTMEHRGGMLYRVFVAQAGQVASAPQYFDKIMNTFTFK